MHSLNKILLSNLLFILIAFSSLAQSAEFPSALTMRKLFVNKDFTQLNAEIEKYQKRYEQDITEEIAFDVAFNCFDSPEPAYEQLFEQWLKQNPTSYIPLLARSRYYQQMGWHHRGDKSASKTSSKRFEKLHFYQNKALLDINKALSIKPKLSLLYAEKISIAKGLSDRKLNLKTLKEGLKLNPASYELRKSQLFNLLPRWGGSYDQIATFLADTKKYESINANLKPLAGFNDYAKGFRAKEKKRFNEGIKLLTSALKHGDKLWFYQERGRCHYFLKNYDKALLDYDRALALHPESVTTLSWRSWAYRKLGKNAEALGDLDLAVELDPFDYNAIRSRAYLLTEFNLFDEAVDNFKKAVILDSSKAETWSSLGWYASVKLKDNKVASNAYKQATVLEPNNVLYVYNYALVLNNMRDCKMTPVVNRFLQLCKTSKSDECSPDKINWANGIIKFLAKSNTCPK
jgi:tetratricopeptide (TPR) repeat protein